MLPQRKRHQINNTLFNFMFKWFTEYKVAVAYFVTRTKKAERNCLVGVYVLFILSLCVYFKNYILEWKYFLLATSIFTDKLWREKDVSDMHGKLKSFIRLLPVILPFVMLCTYIVCEDHCALTFFCNKLGKLSLLL